jgi:hypothetical protein
MDHGPDCDKPGKRALVKWKAYQDAPPTAQDVRQWWAQWPEANLGLVTGASGQVVVVDVDGHDAMTALGQHGVLPETLTALSGRPGGRHYYFQHPGGYVATRAAVLPGVDVRADGGLVVLPPSRHYSGTAYRWDSASLEHGLARLPAWLLALITTAPEQHSRERIVAVGEDIPEGTRNGKLLSLAGAMRRVGATEDEMLAALSLANTNRCRPPLPEAEVCTIVASAGRYAPEAVPDSRSLIESGIGKEAESGVVRVWERREPEPRAFVLPDLVPADTTTIWYGDAGVYKTLLAIYAATCAAAPLPWLGTPIEQQVVLYVDAELDLDEFTRRAYRVARGLGLDKPPEGLHYYQLTTSLADPATIERVAAERRAIGATWTMLDSLSVATFGGDLERPALMTAVMQQVRSWGTVLALDHQPKPVAGVPTHLYRPFGSQFKYALARSVVQVLPADSGRGIVLRPTKANFGALAVPLGLSITFTSDAVEVNPVALGSDTLAGVEGHLPKLEVVARALGSDPGGRHPADMVDECEMSEKTIRNHLATLRQQERAEPRGDGRWRLLPDSRLLKDRESGRGAAA